MTRISIIPLTAYLLAAAAPGWADPHESFLREARIVERIGAAAGEQQAYLARLSDGRTTRTALIQAVTPYDYGWMRSRDDFKYNVAAYRLDRMLGAGVVPCSVVREIEGVRSSVTIWDRDSTESSRSKVLRALIGDLSGTYAGGFVRTRRVVDVDPSVVDDELRAALESLNRKELRRQMGELLSDREIRFLICRRNQILERCNDAG